MTEPRAALTNLGVGIGLRVPHWPRLFETTPSVDVFEIISENFMVEGGAPRSNLDWLLERYPVVQHGVSLGIASADPLDWDYLRRLKALCDHTGTPWFSDHLCWTRAHGTNLHDLLPVPYTHEIAAYVAERVRIVQDFIERPFALENLSSYVTFAESELTEWEFYREVVERAGAYMMLDVNNVFVSSVNHGFEPLDYLADLPYERVAQVHVAGHSDLGDGTLLDTHDHPVPDSVWALYEQVWERTGGVTTILEWDDNIPAFDDVLAESAKARAFHSTTSRPRVVV